MATTLKASISLSDTATLAKPVDDLSQTANVLKLASTQNFTNGTGTDQCNATYHKVRSIASSGNEALDLSGVLTDPFGTVQAFTSIKSIDIQNRSATESLIVGGAAANGFIAWVADATDKIKIRPLGRLVLIAPDATGYAVVAGTADQLKIAAAGDGDGTGMVYAIILHGTV